MTNEIHRLYQVVVKGMLHLQTLVGMPDTPLLDMVRSPEKILLCYQLLIL